ncbi:MAG: leucine-rich repeat domain-containing protein, partial [Ureaplasma sp.]|nr:leucine-rich repeat domain-containing protein [Ureaplasma sp.]
KKHIVASNIKIGTIVQSVTFTQNKDTQTIYFNIELEENDKREYLTSKDFSEATLTKNVLTIQKLDSVIMNDFFTETDPIDNTKLNDLLQQIQNWIKNNQLTKEEFENAINDGTLKDKIKDWLGINADLIGNIKYEHPKLIIEPKPPYTFVSNGDNDLIIDGNIEISNIKFYRIIKFINLDNLLNKLNEIVHSINGENTKPEDFKRYLETHSILDTIYNNLNVENGQTFNKNDILNIELNNMDQLIVSLKSYEYLKYQVEQNINFKINNNQLIIDNLDFYYESNVSESDFIIQKNVMFFENKYYDIDCIVGINWSVQQQLHNIIIPKQIIKNWKYDFDFFQNRCFSNTTFESMDMKALNKWAGQIGDTGTNIPRMDCAPFGISDYMFENNKNLKNIILPKNTKEIGERSFRCCISLESINLPNTLKKINDQAFAESGLKSLVIPESVTYLGSGIFMNTPLEWVKITSKIKRIFSNSFGSKNPITIYVPTQKLKTYYDSLNLYNIKEVIVGEPPAN